MSVKKENEQMSVTYGSDVKSKFIRAEYSPERRSLQNLCPDAPQEIILQALTLHFDRTNPKDELGTS